MKRIILDVDNTISYARNSEYSKAQVDELVVNKIREYKKMGFEIILFTSRNVRTYDGNLGKINANTLPILVDWLKENDIPYDEIYVGKPWCGYGGFYVDDRAIRPDEFKNLTYEEIAKLTGIESN